jgi:hypothetical protein
MLLSIKNFSNDYLLNGGCVYGICKKEVSWNVKFKNPATNKRVNRYFEFDEELNFTYRP